MDHIRNSLLVRSQIAVGSSVFPRSERARLDREREQLLEGLGLHRGPVLPCQLANSTQKR